MIEHKKINTSLSSLNKVILCLALGDKREHVPYRDSKLTRLLQDSLSSADCLTTLIATVSGDQTNLNETLQTLKFAQRAKAITRQ